jgi:hypothetical protein
MPETEMHPPRRTILAVACAMGLVTTTSVFAHDEGGPGLLLSLPYDTPPQHSVGPYFSLNSIPAYNSRPSAHAKIFLEFRGNTTTDWGGLVPGTTPAYDVDGNPTSFSQTELDNVHQIWQRVSEKFSPWDINVTTVDPGVYNPYDTARIVIGGNGKNDGSNYWYGGANPAGGISYVGGFTNPDPNITTAFVFSGNLGNGFPKYVAEASAHETGHLFGLIHQSVYSGTQKILEYNPGTGTGPGSKAPIMGRSYEAERGLWWKGQDSLIWNHIQYDLDSFAGDVNLFDFRPDDHADTFDQADALQISGTSALGSGVIEYMTDKDFFSFATLGGQIHLEIDPFSPGGMLDASLALYDINGTLLQLAATSSLSESIDTILAPGQYELAVLSAGKYGDVGQYTVGAYVPEPGAMAVMLLALIALRRRRAFPLARYSGRGSG